jgi:hypothetical protein
MIALACACVGVTTPSVRAQATEAAVKAAYIYRFLEYVSWPAESFRNAEEPIVIGTTQDDDVAAELARVTRDRTVQNRRLTLVDVRDERDLAVHVLYVPPGNSPRLSRVLEAARQRPILIITNSAGGLDKGGVINFVAAGGRIQFEVSLEAAHRAGLTISARLLAVALRVKKTERSNRLVAHAFVRNLRDSRCHVLPRARAVPWPFGAVMLRVPAV